METLARNLGNFKSNLCQALIIESVHSSKKITFTATDRYQTSATILLLQPFPSSLFVTPSEPVSDQTSIGHRAPSIASLNSVISSLSLITPSVVEDSSKC